MSEELIVRKENIADLYDIGEQIGSGQFAVVKKLQEKSTRETFAAKFMKKKRSKALKKGITQEQFLREADVLRSVDHKGIIRLHEIFETQVEFVLILELLSGGELFEFLSEQEFLTEDEAVGFLKQVIEAIGYLHSKSIAHLDIKPENIVLKEEGSTQVKLIDFGLARKLCKGEMVREIMGTPEFVAPEIIAFEAVETETDMWAIGVLTYIMLSGASPFLGDDVNETFSNISMVDYEFDEEYFKDISFSAKDFISNLLVKDTCDRLTASQCLDHEWMQEVEDRSSEDDDNLSDSLITDETPNRKSELKKRRSTMIKTDAFKAFTARARWQKSLNKVIAISRLALLGKKNGPLQRNNADADTTEPSRISQTNDHNVERYEEKSAMKTDVETIGEKQKEMDEITKKQLPGKGICLEGIGEGRGSELKKRENLDHENDGNKNELHRNETHFQNSTTVGENGDGKYFEENKVGALDIEGKDSEKQELPVNEPDKLVEPVEPVSSSVLEIKERESPSSTQRNSHRVSEDINNSMPEKRVNVEKIVETKYKPQRREKIESEDAHKKASQNQDRLNRFENLRAKFSKSPEITGKTHETDSERRFSGETPTKHKEDYLLERIRTQPRRKSDQLSSRVNWERRLAKSSETAPKRYNKVETIQRLDKPSSSERQRSRSQQLDKHSTNGKQTPNSDEGQKEPPRRISAPSTNEGEPSSSERQRSRSQQVDTHSTNGKQTPNSDGGQKEPPQRISAPSANEGVRAKRFDDPVWVKRPSSIRKIDERREKKNILRGLTSTKAEVLKWEQRSAGKTPPNRSSASREKPLKEHASTGEQQRLPAKTTKSSITTDMGKCTAKKYSTDRDETPVLSSDEINKSERITSNSEASSIRTSVSRVQESTDGEHVNNVPTAVIDKEHTFVIQTSLQSQEGSKTKVETDSVAIHRMTSSARHTERKVGVVEIPVENPVRIENELGTKDVPRENQEQRKVQTFVKLEVQPDETDFPVMVENEIDTKDVPTDNQEQRKVQTFVKLEVQPDETDFPVMVENEIDTKDVPTDIQEQRKVQTFVKVEVQPDETDFPVMVENEIDTKDVPKDNQEQRKVQTFVKVDVQPDETDFPQYALTLQKTSATDEGDEKEDFVWVVRTEKNKRRDFLTKVLSAKINAARNKGQKSAPYDIFEKKRIRHKPMSEKGPPNLKVRTKSTPSESATSKAEMKVRHHSVSATGPTRDMKNLAHIQLTSDMPTVNFKIQMGEIKFSDL